MVNEIVSQEEGILVSRLSEGITGSVQYAFDTEDRLFENYQRVRQYGESMVDIGLAKKYSMYTDGARLTINVILKWE